MFKYISSPASVWASVNKALTSSFCFLGRFLCKTVLLSHWLLTVAIVISPSNSENQYLTSLGSKSTLILLAWSCALSPSWPFSASKSTMMSADAAAAARSAAARSAAASAASCACLWAFLLAALCSLLGSSCSRLVACWRTSSTGGGSGLSRALGEADAL